MPGNLLSVDTSFPHLSENQSSDEKIEVILNYLYMLREQLRYTLGNLDSGNFNDTGLTQIGNKFTDPVYAKIEDTDGNVANLEIKADKVNWLIESGTDATNFTMTSRATTLVSQSIDFTGYVTLNALKTSDGTTIINGSNITTGRIQSANYNGGESGTPTAGSRLTLSDGSFKSPNLTWTSAGVVTATGVTITGAINATSGSIGTGSTKWTIGGDASRGWLYTGKSSMTAYTTAGAYLGTDGIAIGAGTSSAHKFAVSSAGILNCADATVTGAINATSGTIGTSDMPWNIGGDTARAYISNGKYSFDGDLATGIYIGTDGIAIGGPTNGSIKISRLGVMSAPQITIANRINFGSDVVAIQLVGTDSLELLAYDNINFICSTFTCNGYKTVFNKSVYPNIDIRLDVTLDPKRLYVYYYNRFTGIEDYVGFAPLLV